MMRIYVDTSVIGGCFDQEFAEWSNKLVSEINTGEKVAVISDLTLQELEKAPLQVRQLIQNIPIKHLTMIVLDEESKALAKRYIQERAISSKHMVDAQHIAMATIHREMFYWNILDEL